MAETALSLVVTKEMLDKLQKADDKLKQLAQTSDAASKKIIASFKSINTQGIGAFINRLDEAQRKLSQLGSTRLNLGLDTTTTTQSVDDINKLIQAINNLVQGNNNLENSYRGLSDAQRYRIDNRIAALNYREELNAIREKINLERERERELIRSDKRNQRKHAETMAQLKAEIKEINRFATAYAQIPKNLTTKQVGNLIARSVQSDKTINQNLVAIKNLEKAKKDLDTTDRRYQQTLDKINSEIARHKEILRKMGVNVDKVKNSHLSLMQTMNRFRQLVGVAFSISRITNFANKLMNVRKEFEMQQRSLQALLQNKDEADKLWQKTIDLAVKSPFRVKELVTYTKQLAAYRIESDKLYETNKMLADISAGLGVDMQRLILAYGQVKAANYLRGTELRQFSEAGVNILGELSNYFTELEGRAVSVGDVFERVSKRMVSFSDVEEIFKRLTSAGGTFYRMQEIQSETLKGLLSNLGDSIDVMLNDIGREHDSTLKGAVGSVKNLVENWREFAFVLNSFILPTLTTYLSITTLIRVANSSFATSILNLFMSFRQGEAILISTERSIANLLTKLGLGTKATSGFIKVLGGFATLGVAGIIAGIVVGIGALITHLTRASREAKRLQKELDAIHNEDKTNLDLQIKGYENLILRLKDVVKGSKEHYEIINKLNSQYGEQIGFLVTETTTYEQLKNAIDGVNLSLKRRAKLNTYEKSIAKVYESTNKAILDSEKQFTEGIRGILARWEGKDLLSYSLDDTEISKVLDKVDTKIEELGRNLTYSELLTTINDALEKQLVFNGSANALLGVIENRSKAILQRKEKELEIDKAINKLYEDNANSASEAQKAFAQLEKEQEEALKKAAKKPKWEQEEIKRQFAEQKIDLQVKYEGLDEGVAKMRKEALNRISATINDINKKIEGNVKTLGEKFANLIYITPTEAETGLSQIAESTAGSYKSQQEIIKQQNALKAVGTDYDETILENAEKTAAAYYYKLQLMGRLDLLEKEQNKEEKKELQLLNKQISALKEARQTFDSLNEKFGLDEATSRTSKAFEDLFKELDMQDLTLGMSFDISGVMKVLKQLPNLAGEAGRIAIEKFNAELQGGLDVDAQVLADTKLLREIENMFTGYEVSLELQKLNIPKDWAKDFFGIKTFDLSDIRTKIESELQKKIGEDRRKELEKDLEKVKEMEVKAQQERLKTYLQYARDAVGDRAKIKLEEMRKLQEIEKTFTTPEQEDVKQKAIAKVKEDSQKDLNKLEWEEFQKSDTFIDLFDDLDNASSALINHSIEKLREFKDQWKDMPLEDMRAIVNKINELEIALSNINPFSGDNLRKSLRDMEKNAKFGSEDAQELARQKKYQDAFEVERAFQEERALASEKEIADLESIIRLKEEGKDIDDISLNLSDNQLMLSKLRLETLNWMLKIEKEQNKNAQQGVTNSNNYLSTLTKQQKKQLAQAEAISKANDMANNLYDAFKQLNDVLGGNDSVGAIFADMGMQMLNTVLQTVALNLQLQAATTSATIFGVALNTAMGVVGWIVMAVQLIAQVLGAIFAAHDKRLENQIESLKDSVEQLDDKLVDLEKHLEKAFNVSQLEYYTKQVEKNIKIQIAAYQKMIALEEDKKKTDEDTIKGYQDTIKDLQDKLVELQEDVVSKATSSILDDTLSTAREFVDAWSDSFSEVGDGMKGLESNFKEMLSNLIKQQASMVIAGNFLDRWKAQLDKYINKDDLELTTNEAKAWVDSVQKELPQLNEALETYFKAMEQAGIDLSDTSGELSGLQAGIKSITEAQAASIEAYLNSIRFYVAQDNSLLTQLINSFTNTETPNPILSELRSQSEMIRTIQDMLSSVIGRGNSTHSGAYLKVAM